MQRNHIPYRRRSPVYLLRHPFPLLPPTPSPLPHPPQPRPLPHPVPQPPLFPLIQFPSHDALSQRGNCVVTAQVVTMSRVTTARLEDLTRPISTVIIRRRFLRNLFISHSQREAPTSATQSHTHTATDIHTPPHTHAHKHTHAQTHAGTRDRHEHTMTLSQRHTRTQTYT